MPTKKYIDPLVDYLNYAADMRGRIINQVAEMERMIDAYICEHFCHSIEKRNELMEVVIATKHITFQAKAEIVQCLLKKTEDATIFEANKIYTALVNKIAYKRNMIAHFTLDTSRPSLILFKNDKQTIHFLKYANTRTRVPFNKKDSIELGQLILAIKAFFLEIKYKRRKK